jgi:hypothetical protein
LRGANDLIFGESSGTKKLAHRAKSGNSFPSATRNFSPGLGLDYVGNFLAHRAVSRSIAAKETVLASRNVVGEFAI